MPDGNLIMTMLGLFITLAALGGIAYKINKGDW